MFVSNYPHNVAFGEVEMRIFLKFLRNQPLTKDENIRADQMKNTLEAVLSKKSGTHQHRFAGQKPPKYVQSETHFDDSESEYFDEEEEVDSDLVQS